MASDFDNLGIHIESDFDPKGFNQLDAQLNKTSASTAKASVGSSKLKTEILGMAKGSTQAAGGLDKVAGAARKGGAGVESMMRPFRALTKLLPGVGELAMSCFTIMGAGITAAVVGFMGLMNHVRKIDEEYKRFKEEAAKPLTDTLKAQKQAAVDLAVAYTELGIKIREASNQTMSSKDRMGERTEDFQIGVAVEERINSALNKVKMAWLDLGHKTGMVKEQQYAKARLDLELDTIKKKYDAEKEARDMDLKNKKLALKEAEDAAKDLQVKAVTDIANAVDAQAKVRALPSAAQLQEEAKKAQDRVEEQQEPGFWKTVGGTARKAAPYLFPMTPQIGEKTAAFLDDYSTTPDVDILQAEANMRAKLAKKGVAVESRARVNEALATAQAGQTQGMLTGELGTVRDLSRQIPRAEDAAAIQQNAADVSMKSDVQSAQAAYLGSTQAGQLASAATAARGTARNTEQFANQAMALTDSLTQTAKNMQRAGYSLKAIDEQMKALQAQIGNRQ